MSLSQFDVVQTNIQQAKQHKDRNTLWTILQIIFIVFSSPLLFVSLLNAIPVAIYGGLFYLAHYLLYVDPTHSSYESWTGLAGTV